MSQLVLPVGGAEFQATHHAQDFRVQTGDVGIEGGLFAGFVDDLVNGLGLFFDDLFDVSGMNAAIHGEAGEGAAGDLAADRVRSRRR